MQYITDTFSAGTKRLLWRHKSVIHYYYIHRCVVVYMGVSWLKNIQTRLSHEEAKLFEKAKGILRISDYALAKRAIAEFCMRLINKHKGKTPELKTDQSSLLADDHGVIILKWVICGLWHITDVMRIQVYLSPDEASLFEKVKKLLKFTSDYALAKVAIITFCNDVLEELDYTVDYSA